MSPSHFSALTPHFQTTTHPAHTHHLLSHSQGESRKQLEKQIVASRPSPGPLALTNDWTFTWMNTVLTLVFQLQRKKHKEQCNCTNLKECCSSWQTRSLINFAVCGEKIGSSVTLGHHKFFRDLLAAMATHTGLHSPGRELSQ